MARSRVSKSCLMAELYFLLSIVLGKSFTNVLNKQKKKFQNHIYWVKYFAFFAEASSVDENLRKHHTKVNTALLHSEAVLQRCSPRNMLRKHEANPQENKNAQAQCQQSRFGTLLKSHPRTDTSPKIQSASTEHPPPEEQFQGTASAYPKKFKRLNLYKVFIYNCKKRFINTKNE